MNILYKKSQLYFFCTKKMPRIYFVKKRGLKSCGTLQLIQKSMKKNILFVFFSFIQHILNLIKTHEDY